MLQRALPAGFIAPCTTTRHMIGTHELASMKPEAIIVNSSRGPVIDEAALARALADNKLIGANEGGTPPLNALHEGGVGLLVEIWRSCCAPPVEPPSPQTHRDARGVGDASHYSPVSPQLAAAGYRTKVPSAMPARSRRKSPT